MAENKKNMTDQVYEELFHMLVSGRYAIGDKIPSEHELKEMFGVSRNTIRAALSRMNVLGIVETRHGDGTYLKGMGTNMYLNTFIPAFLSNSDDLMELMVFRRGVEISAARMAAINATEEDIKSLEGYFEAIGHGEISNKAFAEATNNFHTMVAIASKNDILKQMLELIGWIITSKMADFLLYRPSVDDSSYYHYMVFRCIKQRKPDEAAYMMDRHMELLLERVKDYLQYTKTHLIQESGEARVVRRRPLAFSNEEDLHDEHTHDDESRRFDGL